jgi:hypothetical protein
VEPTWLPRSRPRPRRAIRPPGLYKLIVAARPSRRVVSDTLVLDARRGVRLEASAPQWLTVGDRSLVAVRVENAYVEPIQAQVRCEVGDSLRGGRVLKS